VKPLRPPTPEPRRRAGPAAIAALGVSLAAVIWLLCFALLRADLISGRTLLVVAAIGLPVAGLVLMGLDWPPPIGRSGACREVPPPADVAALWSFDDGPKPASRRRRRLDRPARPRRDAGEPRPRGERGAD
jgi:hypothetical protein